MHKSRHINLKWPRAIKLTNTSVRCQEGHSGFTKG